MTKNEALKVVGENESLIEKFGAPNDQALSDLKRLLLSPQKVFHSLILFLGDFELEGRTSDREYVEALGLHSL